METSTSTELSDRADPVLDRLCSELLAWPGGDGVMHAIDRARAAWVGAGLLTVNRKLEGPAAQREVWQLQRIWSSNRDVYPVGGCKFKPLTPWARRLFVDQQMFRTEGRAAMAQTFDDHMVMAGLGLQSAVNVPIVRDRICVATFNCMSVRPAWSARQLALVRTLALLASAWIFQEVDRWQTSQAA